MQFCELLGVFLITAWCFRLSISYQFGLFLYCRHLDVEIELDTCVGSWLYLCDRLLGYCSVYGLFCVIFKRLMGIVFVLRLGAVVWTLYRYGNLILWDIMLEKILLKSLLSDLLIICGAINVFGTIMGIPDLGFYWEICRSLKYWLFDFKIWSKDLNII